MNQIELPERTRKTVAHALPDPLAPIQDMVRACIQWGTRTGSFPNAFAMACLSLPFTDASV